MRRSGALASVASRARAAAVIASTASGPSLPRALSTAAAEAVGSSPGVDAEQAAALAGSASGDEPRRKYPSRFRRARSLMADVRADSLDKAKAKLKHMRPELPAWNIGDAVELEYAFERGDAEPTVIRGSITGRRRSGSLDASFVMMNDFGDDVLTTRIPVMTPLLRSMRVMRKNHVRSGKRVRRAQLTYLRDRPVSEFRVTVDTKEEWEHALEAKIRRELQRLGRNWGKRAVAEEKARIFKTGKGVVRVDSAMSFSKEDVAKAAAAVRSKKSKKA